MPCLENISHHGFNGHSLLFQVTVYSVEAFAQAKDTAQRHQAQQLSLQCKETHRSLD